MAMRRRWVSFDLSESAAGISECSKILGDSTLVI